jgi:hypothetical protein
MRGAENPAPFTKTVKDAAPGSYRIGNSSRGEIVYVRTLILGIEVRGERKKALIRDSEQGPLVSTAD